MAIDLTDLFGGYGVRDAQVFSDADQAVARIEAIYQAGAARLRETLKGFAQGVEPGPIDACYPFVGIVVEARHLALDGRIAYGVLHEPGVYGTTLTRPDIFRDYYRNQIAILMANHQQPVVVGVSDRSIPLPFAVEEIPEGLDETARRRLQHLFPMPDLSRTDDAIANGTAARAPGRPGALALFTAERVDYSLARVSHYTGTSPGWVQRFILLTNYQRYVEHFVTWGRRQVLEGDEYDFLVEPGNVTTPNARMTDAQPSGTAPAHLPQMPAYHLTRPDGRGITLVNIGVGPSNARTITDHLAVLRPHCWLMLGHCAGLRRSQQLGDYVLAHGYVRDDHVLDDEVPPFVPIPPIAEVQVALQQAVANVTGLSGLDQKTRMRTGTVASTDNRNWELRYDEFFERLSQSRTIAVDMESATIATNGFRFRVPYGTLLCVSDKPLHGEIKLRGSADLFYRQRVEQHLLVGLEAIRLLREQGPDRLHSRKLRSFDEPAFR
ncbi:AMP nucleosidase [Geminicoccus roseus]|uniref:AMP nucleosidase n=1 Tax=Geminicoccus roseus TaxID=404900 RepID=UPI0003FDC28C|nr:AMP nucleosidase [Geminicoccus roseus]